MRKPFFLLFFLCFLYLSGTAQKVQFKLYTTADGLAGNLTTAITQDEEGYMWFINDEKIVRFDGRDFLINPFSNPLLNDGLITGINTFQDSLFILKKNHELLLLNPKTGHVQSFLPKAKKNDQFLIEDFIKLPNDHFIINGNKNKDAHDRVYWLFDGHSLQNLPQIDNRDPKIIYQVDSIDIKYFVISDAPETEVKAIQFDSQQLKTSIPKLNKHVYNPLTFYNNATGEILICVSNRFILYHPEKNRFRFHPINRFLENWLSSSRDFILEKNGNIWLCGGLRNLSFYDAAKDSLFSFQKELSEHHMPNEAIFFSLYKDNTGTIWVNTSMGLLQVIPQSQGFDTYFTDKEKSLHREVAARFYSFRGFTEDTNGDIYGGYYDGIVKIDPEKKTQTILAKGLAAPFDLDMHQDKIVLNSGHLFEPYTNAIFQPKNSAPWRGDDFGVFERDKSQRLWWIYNAKLFYLETVEDTPIWKEELKLPIANSFGAEAFYYGQKSDKLWIGFQAMLFAYQPQSKKLEQFGPEKIGLPLSRIMAIEEDGEGNLWLATDNGLIQFHPEKGLMHHFSTDDGLPNNFLCGMLNDGDSCLWLGTNYGLSRFHIQQEKFTNFSEKDGLSSNEFNRMSYYKAQNGRMFFGGVRGVNAFFPKSVMAAIRNKNKAAKVTLSSFEKVDVQKDTIIKKHIFSNQTEIHLYHWDKSFRFEYALTDYTNPKEIFYSYKMDGYENIWSAPSSFNFTRFSSLPTGSYTFRAKARDTRGHWHPNELAIKVVVHPPWWETTWAYLLYVLTALAMGFGIFYFLNKRWQLQNQLLMEQQEANRLKQLDEFKSKLYTNLTHEFRTPLTVILGMTQQIRSEPKKYLDEGTQLIELNGKNLLRLINQLLDLSKLENKSFQMKMQQGDIIPFLKYITESFHTYVNSKNLSLRFFTLEESLMMDHDPEQIKQMLINLISNAVKFTPSGGEIMVKVEKENEQLKIEVIDTGIGIAEKDRPHIFDRFYQVDGSMTREGEGTGIGLAHTKELVKLMDGNIYVKSLLKKGSTFTILLPIRNVAPVLEKGFDKKEITPVIWGLKNHPQIAEANIPIADAPQLLIIEDNHDVVVYLKACLERAYQINIAYNGQIGIERALENIPDLIISDVMMPQKNGFEVCDFLKNDERTSHIPIILLTAKADPNSKISGLKRGADAYLSKPFDEKELLVRLEKLVERQQKMRAYFSEQTSGEESEVIEEAVQIENEFIQKLKKIIEENYSDENFALPQLCQKVRMSRSQLFRKMKALLGSSPSDYLRTYRLEQAKQLLETKDYNVAEAAYKAGFKDPSYFSKIFQEAFGIPPSAINK